MSAILQKRYLSEQDYTLRAAAGLDLTTTSTPPGTDDASGGETPDELA